MKFALAVLSLVVCASAVDVQVGYHRKVGIPLAMKIKAAEEAIIRRNANSRIAGGEEAEQNAHPYVAGIVATLEGTPFPSACGGALVSAKKALTSASCWDDGVDRAIRFVVVLGSRFLFTGGRRIETTDVVTHPDWNPLSLENNVAVIGLRNPVLLSESIQPIALPTDLEEDFTGEQTVAVGYGMTSDDQAGVSVFSVLKEVEVTVLSTEACQAVYGWWARDSNICTSGVGGVGICGGDLGAPLVAIRDEQPVLVGVGSFYASTGCQAGHPSAFSRITSFNDFITQFLK